MSELVAQVMRLLGECTHTERQLVFAELRKTLRIHDFEQTMNAPAEVILEALHRASNLTQLGIRGIIGEATFMLDEAAKFEGWESVPFSGDQSYDAIFRNSDTNQRVTVQVKMQRREKGVPLIRKGRAIVEVQRTRGGKRNGEDTRPYKFGEFDILAVCMEPSHGRWNSFLYIPARWLVPRKHNNSLIDIFQSVSLTPDATWSDSFQESVERMNSAVARPQTNQPGLFNDTD